MQQDSSVSRRRLLTAVGCTSAAVLGGCLTDDEDRSDPSTDEGQPDGDDESAADEADSEQSRSEESAPEEPEQGQVATAGDWPMELQNAQRNPVVADRGGPTEPPERRWSYELPTSEEEDDLFQQTARPVVHDGTVYAQTLEGTCIALDAGSGELEWSESVPRDSFDASIVTPAVTADALVVASEGVQALDPDDGTERWHVPMEFSVEWISITEEQVIVSDLTDIVAIEPSSGEQRWRVDRLRSPAFLAIDESGDTVFTQDKFDDSFVAIDAETGERRWKNTPEVQNGTDFFTVADGTVYLVSPLGATLTALDAVDGTIEQTAEFSLPDEAAIIDDTVFLPTRSEESPLLALDREDLRRQSDWALDVEDAIAGPPVVTSDAIFAWTTGQTETGILAADRSSGEVLWQYDLEPPVDGFAVTENFLYAFTDGEIVALGPA